MVVQEEAFSNPRVCLVAAQLSVTSPCLAAGPHLVLKHVLLPQRQEWQGQRECGSVEIRSVLGGKARVLGRTLV